MFKRTKISSCVLLALGGTLLVPTASVFAQAAPSDQRIEITGSRIRSLNADSPSPVQVLTSEDIAASGATTVQEVLLKNPTMGTPTISRTNSNFSTSSAGVATVDLRNLGVDRTLVLINGRRSVSGVPGSSAVDLNTIPTDFVERIEIMTGGASATYGSDAVAGVVNIILKKNFEGFTFDAQAGTSQENDDDKKKVSVTFGSTSANGRSNVMGYLSYSDQGAVYSRDRSMSAIDQASVGAFVTGDPRDLFAIQRPFYSSFAPQGRFFYDANGAAAGGRTSRTFDADGNVIPFSSNGPAGDGVGATGFNRSAFRTIAIPTKRFVFSAKGDHAINDEHTAFFEGTYASTQTKTKLEPFPLSSDDIFPDTGGVLPADFLVNGVMTKNPLIPQAMYDRFTDADGDGAREYDFTRRLSEVGNRGNTADRAFYRAVTGFKGDLTKKLQYDAFVGYGSTTESQVSSGQVNVLNFASALEGVPDVLDINGNGNTTEAICRNERARAQGCVPINVFGYNSISPEALAYVTAPGLLATFTSQALAGFAVNGEPLDMPAGPLGIAAGFEYRKEKSRSEFDPLQQAGLNGGNKIPRTEGEFDVKELYAEARVPLLKDMSFAKSLSALLAVRGSDYSTVGNTTSWNAGLEWTVNPSLKFRATKALSTRAPNINELYSPPSETFPTGIQDPCVGVTATSVGVTSDRCRAATGVTSNITDNGGVFVQSQADQQGIGGFDRGNPTLQEEKGKSFTAGMIFLPTMFPALRSVVFAVDYFNIDIDDAIVSTPRQFILEQCYGGGNTSLCQFVTRRATVVGANNAGSLEFIDSAVTNSGGLETEGVDFTVTYADKVGPGRLSGKFAYTHMISGSITPLVGSAKDPFAGEVGAAKDKFNLQIGYDWNNWGLRTTTTYIAASALDDQFLAGFTDANGDPLAPGSVKIGSKTYFDFQLTYNLAKRSQLYFGVDNAFNTGAPSIPSGLPGNTTGAETDAGTYDAIGRRYYAGVRMSF
jgi:outer membrane receptor protein involved in Fe transport